MVRKILACAVLVPFAAFATTINVQYATSTTWSTTALTGFATDGDMMDGMDVTVELADGSFETADWADTGPGAGSASGTGWSLSLSGDSFGSPWSLVSTGAEIKGLLIDAGSGDAVFDVVSSLDPSVSTDGSARGWAFDFQSLSGSLAIDEITATYMDEVALEGDAPVGDLYRYLEIDFGDDKLAMAPGANQATMTYIADTDNLSISGDIVPDVPEPATMSLLGLGLIGIVAFARKRK